MLTNFKDFLENILVENLHVELQDVINSPQGRKSKQTELAHKIKDLTNRGESTGIEGNMPKGSSRAYLKHADKHSITLDGKHAEIEHGTKVAIKSSLDRKHNKLKYKDYDHPHGMSLGQLQNHAENGDDWVNQTYRILSHDTEHPGNYKSNKESGIFPPLIEHDDKDHWSHVGHAHDIKGGEFNKLTKTESHPHGISHNEFMAAMDRHHSKSNGGYWDQGPKHEEHMDHISDHPLVQKFQDYHGNTGHPHYDLRQLKNMGVFHHPDGSKHIVARDHGFSSEVERAYYNARLKK